MSKSCRAVAGASRCTHENVKSNGFARSVSQKLEFGGRMQKSFSMSSRHVMHPKMMVSLEERRKHEF